MINIILVLSFVVVVVNWTNWWSGQCFCPPCTHGTGPHDTSEKSEPQNKISKLQQPNLWVLQWHRLWGAVCSKHSVAQSVSGFSGMPGKLVGKQQLNRCWTAPELPYTNIQWELIRMRLLRAGMIIELKCWAKGQKRLIFTFIKKPLVKTWESKGLFRLFGSWLKLKFSNYLHSPVTSLVSGKKIT